MVPSDKFMFNESKGNNGKVIPANRARCTKAVNGFECVELGTRLNSINMEAPKPKKSTSKRTKKDQRLEERLGGSFNERDDSELFVIDHAIPKVEPKEKNKPLKCFSSLENHSKIPDPVRKRNRVRSLVERENPLIKHLRNKNKLKDRVGKVHRELHEKKKNSRKSSEILENEWIGPDSKKQALGNTNGGSSYNPSLNDHRNLLWHTALTEIQREKAVRRIEKHTTEMYPSRRQTKEEEFKELAQGLAGLDSDLDKESEEEEEEKRKQKAFKAAEKRRLIQNAKMDKERGVFRIKTFKKELDKLDQDIEENRHRFEKMEEPVKLTDELTGNLRSLRPEGNLLEERYNSMQKRNIVETRVASKKTRKPIGMKLRKKKLQKRSYKMDWEKK
ncbi:NOP53 [Lepeophtheirus salmonis]|uniref:Ribosome biogenesis protein NOP53 n=1 Tax=Lepeophtheirus salmonis TaxID=72036 RepID=A0A7R8D0H2_LEPSM|nr:NOP53 [Lepeophtheirus salmonis]CAF2958936.1 NOP53 [Lepeophtheirus salmonis]